MRRIGRDRRPRRHGLQDHEAEGVGPAREDKDIGVPETPGQLPAEAGPKEFGVRIFLFQLGPRRTVADHDLGARQVRLEEGLDILLDCHPADIQPEGPGPVLPAQFVIDARQIRMELFGVHPSRPGRDIAEAAVQQLVPQCRCRHHQPSRRLVEPFHIGVADLHRDREARRNIFREFRVIAGRERQLPFHADAPRGDADRPLRRDMHRLRLIGAQPFANLFLSPQRQPDFRIGRGGDGLELTRLDDLDIMAHGAAFRDGPGQGADDAVDLGLPGVSGQNDSHEGREAPPLIGRNL